MKNICPRCKEIVLTLWDEEIIVCPKCEEAFDADDSLDEGKKE